MRYFKIKLQLKFSNHKSCCSIFVNFLTGLRCKIGEKKITIRRGPLTGTLSLLCCLSHLSSASLTSLRSGFRNRFILDQFCSNALTVSVLFFQIVRIIEFADKIPTCLLCFPFSICRITLTFPSTLNTFLLFVTVALLSRYQSAVNCTGTNMEGKFRHKVNYRYCCHF